MSEGTFLKFKNEKKLQNFNFFFALVIHRCSYCCKDSFSGKI